MYKIRRRLTADHSAKKALFHGFNLTHFGPIACIALLVAITATPASQQPAQIETTSFEGQAVSSVELAGKPDLNADEFAPLMTQHTGEAFSREKIDQTIAALKATGQFQDVHLDVRPEPDGVRVLFVLQPAVYFGTFDFQGAGGFTYSRLLQVSNYLSQEPYSSVDVQRSETALQTFLRRNGFFEAQVRSETKTDTANRVANVMFYVTLNRRADFGNVNFSGATPEEAARLQAVLRSLMARIHFAAVRSGKNYSLKTLQNATGYLEGNLRGHGHLGARVKLTGAEYNPDTNRADVSFDVQPGPIVKVQVMGARLWPWTRRKLLPVYDEAGLSPELVQEGRQNLLKYFRSQGFFDVQVEAQEEQQPTGELLTYRITKGPRKKIVDVTFTGNEHMDSEELMEHVAVEKAGFLTHGSYKDTSVKTLTAAYMASGFNQVKVTPQFVTREGNIVVNFAIQEGTQDIVESFRVEGNTEHPINELAPDGLRLAKDQPYSQKAVDDDRNKIMSHYLDAGHLTATFRNIAEPLPDNPHRFNVAYSIAEGPHVEAGKLVTLGKSHVRQELIDRDLIALQPGRPLAERELLLSESKLYSHGIFDWAEVNARRSVATEGQEDVIVKVHESRRNVITYGFGFERVNRGGNVPSGTVALPGLPPVGLPNTFKTSEETVAGPRVSVQYTRTNFRGKGETVSFGMLAGPLIRRGSVAYTNPTFRWSKWTSTFSLSGETNKENPIFNSRQGVFSWQLQKPLDEKRTKNIFLRYSFSETGLTHLAIEGLVPHEDLHTRLSTFSGNYIHDTRDNLLDAHKGMYQSAQLDFNSRVLGSSVSFAKLLLQAARYQDIHNGIIWANSIRLGFEQPFAGSRVPISEKFFSGGGSTLRGFPLNGAGPQNTIPACSDPADPSTCAFIRVPTGGTQLVILNSEVRIPVPLKKGLSFATFYDGGNVFHPIGLHNFGGNYTNTVGIGLRYATPVGPIRFDIGRNLNRISGISATQIFITLGQAF